MKPFSIGNLHNSPLNNINGMLVNINNSHVNGIPFSNKIIPTGIHTLPTVHQNIWKKH